MIQIGSKVYIVPNDTRHVPYYRTVKSIGRKYITVDDNLSYARFDIITKESICDKSGWNPHLTLYENKAEYEAEQKVSNLKHSLLISIKMRLTNASVEQLKQINDILKN